jgi:hypothetical protein
MERNQRAQHLRQVVITARYLGVEGRWSNGERARGHCRDGRIIHGAVRFALSGEGPWHGSDFTPARLAKMAMGLPCPELSREQYARLSRHRPDDTEVDGLGHAPVLQRGQTYRLTVVENPDLAEDDAAPDGGEFVWTLVAVNPL